MKSVVGWQTSCWHIFKKPRQFQSIPFQWRLSQLPCHEPTLHPCVFDVETVLPLLRAWEGPTDNFYGINEAKQIIRRASTVEVHAEAMLMHWIATVKVWLSLIYLYCSYPASSFRMFTLARIDPLVSIGCVAKCAGAHNSQKSSKFVLPGTHGIFIPWLPPPGLPDSVLITLQKALLDMTSFYVPAKICCSSVMWL